MECIIIYLTIHCVHIVELANGNHVRTPVLVMKPKSLSDASVEPHADDIPGSELSKLDSIEYCGRDSDNAPG